MRRPRTARDYQDGITEASRSGLAEVMTILGAYRDALVLIGGWAPYLILEKFGEPSQEYIDAERTFNAEVTFGRFLHVGSIDIDLVVDPAIVDTAQYATIVELLLDRGYEPAPDSLYQFQRMIRSPRDGHDYVIRVDILTPSLSGARGGPTATAHSSAISAPGLSQGPRSRWATASGTTLRPRSRMEPERRCG